MRGAYVQEKELVAVRQGWRNCRNATSLVELSRLPRPYTLRQGFNPPDAPALDASQSGRLRGTAGRAGNTMLPGSGFENIPGAAGRWFYRQGGRKPVLFPRALKDPDMALNVDALLAEQTPNKRLGKAPSKLILPVHIWYLWNATGIKSGTFEKRPPPTGIKSGTCGGFSPVPQVSNMNHSY